MRNLPVSENFAKNLLKWWRRNRRHFPWRETSDPYRIFISEVLLHRTRAEQVKPIYLKFIGKFPIIEDATRAPMIEIKGILHPLGLHWRTENLYKSMQKVKNEYQGRIPVCKNDLMSLPGVGQYVSSAVRCFAYGSPEILLDVNTTRILGRIFGLKVTDSSRRSKRFRELYSQIINMDNAREFNYALIDLGSLVCTAIAPQCVKCPVKETCSYEKSRGG